ncbi:hypothetical protein, partial [Streptomyces sp. SID6139]|uniref:hypothetical protein n=1 Tax=Streptomyces sp. SID6139 TaxID=2690320 RepID=UPI001F1CDC0B
AAVDIAVRVVVAVRFVQRRRGLDEGHDLLPRFSLAKANFGRVLLFDTTESTPFVIAPPARKGWANLRLYGFCAHRCPLPLRLPSG